VGVIIRPVGDTTITQESRVNILNDKVTELLCLRLVSRRLLDRLELEFLSINVVGQNVVVSWSAFQQSLWLRLHPIHVTLRLLASPE
jgi:hypothetical protein